DPPRPRWPRVEVQSEVLFSQEIRRFVSLTKSPAIMPGFCVDDCDGRPLLLADQSMRARGPQFFSTRQAPPRAVRSPQSFWAAARLSRPIITRTMVLRPMERFFLRVIIGFSSPISRP